MNILGGSLRWRLIRAGVFVSGAFLFTLPTWSSVPPLAYHNTGSSMPKGYYIYAHSPPAARGEVIVLAHPPHFNLPWLMKRVEGVAGDTFCWDAPLGAQRLNGKPMPPPHPAALGLGLKPWTGCRVLGAGELVGFGISADSYDARYANIGIIKETDLNGVYRMLLPD